MALYLVDYENVNDGGLSGLEVLQADDTLVIFYGPMVRNIPIERHIAMLQSPADIRVFRTERTGKNYIDFQLSSWLGYLLGQGESGPVYIISNDTGFDSVVDLWRARGIRISCRGAIDGRPVTSQVVPVAPKLSAQKVKVKPKAENAKQKTVSAGTVVAEKVPEAFRKQVRSAVKSEQLTTGCYVIIYNAMCTCGNHAEYRRRLSELGEKAKGVYDRTQNIFGEFRKTLGGTK